MTAASAPPADHDGYESSTARQPVLPRGRCRYARSGPARSRGMPGAEIGAAICCTYGDWIRTGGHLFPRHGRRSARAAANSLRRRRGRLCRIGRPLAGEHLKLPKLDDFRYLALAARAFKCPPVVARLFGLDAGKPHFAAAVPADGPINDRLRSLWHKLNPGHLMAPLPHLQREHGSIADAWKDLGPIKSPNYDPVYVGIATLRPKLRRFGKKRSC
jgi:hypothetical protein